MAEKVGVARLPNYAPKGKPATNEWESQEMSVAESEEVEFEPNQEQEQQRKLLLEGDFPELDREVIMQGKVIGKGAFGEVREGRLFGKMKVAVKTVVVKPDELHKLMRELNALAKCKHPNVLNLLGVCTQDPPKVLIITDLVDGGDLKDWLYRDHRLRGVSLVDKLILVHRIAVTLGYLHSIGVVHRDLKPENVLMTSDGEPKICDFGLAKADTELGKSIYTFVGTIHYMAPEIARGESYDEKADVYSFGIIFNEILVGRRPFSELQIKNAAQIFRAIRDGQKPKLATGQPPEVMELIEACLDGNSRYDNKRPSFDQIAERLAEIVDAMCLEESAAVIHEVSQGTDAMMEAVHGSTEMDPRTKEEVTASVSEIQQWARSAKPGGHDVLKEARSRKAKLDEIHLSVPTSARGSARSGGTSSGASSARRSSGAGGSGSNKADPASARRARRSSTEGRPEGQKGGKVGKLGKDGKPKKSCCLM